MSETAVRYFEHLKQKPVIVTANRWLERVSLSGVSLEHLDPTTVRHSRRVAAASAIVSYSADIPPKIIAAMTAGALLHDSGKRHSNVMYASAGRLNLRDPFVRYQHRRHPHDSWLDARTIWPASLPNSAERYAQLFALTHHTNFRAPAQNYPSPDELAVYVDAGEIGRDKNDWGDNELDVAAEYSPLLTVIDHFDALTHPLERPYMTRQLSKAGVDPRDPQSLMRRAIGLAEIDLVAPKDSLSIEEIGLLMAEHRSVIDAFGQASAR